MSPPTRQSRPAGNRAAKSTADEWSGGHFEHSRPILINPTTIRALAAVVPCSLCTHGLCSRCWVVARAVEQLTVAARVDQARDDLAVAA